MADDIPDIVLDHNVSERFECRFSTVRIENSRAMMLQGMSESVLGVWVAHGEGMLFFPHLSCVQQTFLCVNMD